MKGKSVIVLTSVLLITALFTCGNALAFTGWTGEHNPAIAYSPEAQIYATAYLRHDGVLWGRVMDPFGTPRGKEFSIAWGSSDYSRPAIAFDEINKRFLLVWSGGWPYNALMGQFLNGDGSMPDPNMEPFPHLLTFVISNAPETQADPTITYDSVNQRFLVTWNDYRNGDYAIIYGQFVNTDGTLQGNEFIVSNEPQKHPEAGSRRAVEYDGVNQRFLAAWNTGKNVFVQLVNADGTPHGTTVNIWEAQYTGRSMSAAYENKNQRFLVTWNTGFGIPATLGRLVNADGTVQGKEFIISNGTDPSVSYDTVHERFLVVNNYGRDIYGQYVGLDGTPQGAQFPISHKDYNGYWDQDPVVAFNPQCANFLVGFVPTRPSSLHAQAHIAFGIAGDPCRRTSLIVRKRGTGADAGYLHGDSRLACNKKLCKGNYVAGSEVTITASAPWPSVFDKWEGCDVITGTACSVKMDGNKTVTATFRNTPKITATPLHLNFGSIATGSASEKTITVRNSGSGDLMINSIAIQGPHYHQTNTCTTPLAQGDTCTIALTFAPWHKGQHLAKLTINSNAVNKPLIWTDLIGAGK
jgi:hypothetical protein